MTRGAVPAGYQEVLYWKLTANPAQLLWINLLAVPLAVGAAPVFLGLARGVGRAGLEHLQTGADYLGLLAGLLLVLILHEGAHGLVMSACGARPRYGIKWDAGALYATAPGYAFTRNQYLAVIFAPLLLLSALALAGMALWPATALVPILALSAVGNAMGACGDVYMGWRVARYPPAAYVIDEADGMRVFLPEK